MLHTDASVANVDNNNNISTCLIILNDLNHKHCSFFDINLLLQLEVSSHDPM